MSPLDIAYHPTTPHAPMKAINSKRHITSVHDLLPSGPLNVGSKRRASPGN